MPATTRPSANRPHTPRTPARPRPARTRTAAAPLVGLTLETEFGFVDLVAVKRALAGDDRVRLTGAELDWIRCPWREGVREAEYALGAGYSGLTDALDRHARRLSRAGAKHTAVRGGYPL